MVGWLRGLGQRLGRYGSFEASEEFRAKAIAIAEIDPDVQGLLADGYGITRVIPVIKSMVDANGDIARKAVKAVVLLRKGDSKSFATVWVDLNAESVTRIVTLTRTVVK